MGFVSPNNVYADPMLIVGSISALSKDTLIRSTDESFVVFRLIARMYPDFVSKFREAAKRYYIKEAEEYVFISSEQVVVIDDGFLKEVENHDDDV